MTQYYQCGTPTLMNSNLPTISIRTEHTVYPPALQIDLFKRLHRNITRVMVFIQECSCYCHPWNVDITTWSRPYHFIQNLQELYQQNVGATLKHKSTRMRLVMCFILTSTHINERSGNVTTLQTIKSQNWKQWKKKSQWCSVGVGGGMNWKVFGHYLTGLSSYKVTLTCFDW